MSDALRIVEDAEATLAPLSVETNLAWWNSQVDATEENAARRERAEIAWSAALADRDRFAAVRSARENGAGGMVRRRLDLLHDGMLRHQLPDALRERIVELETSVDLRFSRHRGVVGGREVGDTEIKQILRRSDDPRERREAWEASKTVGAVVADDVRELARLRNDGARSLGYRDWFALSLATDELDEGKLVATLAEADRATAEPFARWKAALDERLAARFGCAVSDLRPWHHADPFFQEAPPEGAVDLDPLFEGVDIVDLARRTVEGVGLEAEGIVARSDVYPRDGKNQHAFCIDIDRRGDVRVLANLVTTQESADTMLHELGHGVYDLGYREDLPWLLRSTHLVATEGSALLFGSLAWRREWLERILGVSSREGAELEPRLRAARAVELLVFTRWVLVMNAFERALYANPDGDLDRLWWELVSRYQTVTPPDDRRAPDWAAKIHIAVSPVYYHTYLYGAIVALQLTGALESEVGGIVDRPDAGTLLTERLFSSGQSVRWDRLVEEATGSPLSVESLERAVAAA
ncbi:MAG TPA: M2 family metallopeptidase [Gaiellaceae bacterium]|nr:M2 family metallopeptidase [Gaiellaceae bacterium]